MDYKKIDNIEIEGLDFSDSPDFCDAFIASADYNGKAMTQDQLDTLNDDIEFVHEQVYEYLF